jgi:alanine racemase
LDAQLGSFSVAEIEEALQLREQDKEGGEVPVGNKTEKRDR